VLVTVNFAEAAAKGECSTARPSVSATTVLRHMMYIMRIQSKIYDAMSRREMCLVPEVRPLTRRPSAMLGS
jgi:hypothetical protein